MKQLLLIADLNLTPLNDGTLIRVNVPALTEERRKQYVKNVYALAEEAKVAIRNIRRDANSSLKKLEKEVPEDMLHHYNEEIQKLTDEYVKKIDELAKEKEKELLTV